MDIIFSGRAITRNPLPAGIEDHHGDVPLIHKLPAFPYYSDISSYPFATAPLQE
jgi:hypothetical protein